MLIIVPPFAVPFTLLKFKIKILKYSKIQENLNWTCCTNLGPSKLAMVSNDTRKNIPHNNWVILMSYFLNEKYVCIQYFHMAIVYFIQTQLPACKCLS